MGELKPSTKNKTNCYRGEESDSQSHHITLLKMSISQQKNYKTYTEIENVVHSEEKENSIETLPEKAWTLGLIVKDIKLNMLNEV